MGNALWLFRLRKLEIPRAASACQLSRLSVEISISWWWWKAIFDSGWPGHTWLGGSGDTFLSQKGDTQNDWFWPATLAWLGVTSPVSSATLSRCYISRHAIVCLGNLTLNNPRQISHILKIQWGGEFPGRKIRCTGLRGPHGSLGYSKLVVLKACIWKRNKTKIKTNKHPSRH